jgi:23S rRNA (pseudouridine1915-N3)-methyltransferase
MLFRFIWVGKTRNQSLRTLTEDYLKRLSRFVRCEVQEVRESNARTAREGIEDEGKRILCALPADAFTVLLDVEGEQKSSHELSREVERWQNSGIKQVAFVIGGHYGVSGSVVARANSRWSLSPLTFTHEMVRVLMLEQLYRGYTIINGLPYQK